MLLPLGSTKVNVLQEIELPMLPRAYGVLPGVCSFHAPSTTGDNQEKTKTCRSELLMGRSTSTVKFLRTMDSMLE